MRKEEKVCTCECICTRLCVVEYLRTDWSRRNFSSDIAITADRRISHVASERAGVER